MKFIVLDSTPLGLLTQRKGRPTSNSSRRWLAEKLANGNRIVVPEIIDYELRRELLRAGKASSIRRLDEFVKQPAATYLPLTTQAMKLAAQLWANLRRLGQVTAHEHALDVDVILAAQVLSAGFLAGEFVIATSNVAHLSLLAPCDEWQNV
jgi:predicted nucleic acid-binding protein